MSEINAILPNAPRPNGRPMKTVGDSVQQHIKTAVHKELIKRVDLDKLGEMQETRGAQQQFFTVIQHHHQRARRSAEPGGAGPAGAGGGG